MTELIPSAMDIAHQAVRESIAEMQKECTDEEIAFFRRIADASGIDHSLTNAPWSDLKQVHALFVRTVTKHRKDAENDAPAPVHQ